MSRWRPAALSSGDLFGWREPALPLGPCRRGCPMRSTAWQAEGARIVLACDQSPRLADILGEAGHPVARRPTRSWTRRRRARSRSSSAASTAASRAARTASSSSRTASCSGRSASAARKALRRVVPRDILERLTPGDLVVHIDHGVARYEQMLRRGGDGRGARLPGAVVRRRRPDLRARSSRSPGSRATPAASGRSSPSSAARSGCGPKQRVRKAVADLAEELLAALRRAGRCPAATPSRPTRRGRPRWRPRSRTRRPSTSCAPSAEVKADMEQRQPMDRLVVGDVGYGKTEVALRAAFKATQDGKQVAVLVPDDRPRGPAPRHVQPALRGVPARGPAPVADRLAEGAGGDHRRAGGRDRGPRHRHAPAAQQGHRVQGPRASSSSTRSSASGSPPRSGSSGCATRWTS